jgi:hypothetical protein
LLASRTLGSAPDALNTGFASGLPARANATIRSPAAAGSVRQVRLRHGVNAAQRIDLPGIFAYDQSETACPTGSVAGRRFRSLRLSVRTPPFHGGESGSIPLGSATSILANWHDNLTGLSGLPAEMARHVDDEGHRHAQQQAEAAIARPGKGFP